MKNTAVISKFITIAATVWLLTGCNQEPLGGEQSRTNVFVLVDLSATWHNPANAQRNSRVLKELGEGIAIAADDWEPPITIQHRIIGLRSLEREPVCYARYVPSIVPLRNANPNVIRSSASLHVYLGSNCPDFLMSRPAEQATEISAALASIASQPATNARRLVIVVSDFLEEAVAPAQLKKSMAGMDMLLLYRPLVEDQLNPNKMTERVAAWEGILSKLGAHVEIMPDTAVRRADIVGFLNHK